MPPVFLLTFFSLLGAYVVVAYVYGAAIRPSGAL
jgi:hypothetical protein